MPEPAVEFHPALLKRLEQLSRPTFDALPLEADMPHVDIVGMSLTHDDSHDARAWTGEVTFECWDLVEHGLSRINALLNEIDNLLHDQPQTVVMAGYIANWIRYQSSETARSGDDTRFRGAIVFEVQLEQTGD